jgi:hypothetical protein
VPRSLKLALIALAVLIFVVISAGLARILSANNAERGAIADLVGAEARGDGAAVARLIEGCSPGSACAERQQAAAAKLRRPGDVKIALLTPSSRFVFGDTRGVTRVAWSVIGTGGAKTVTHVQCVGIHRTGNVVSGLGVQITALSAPIANDADCPGQG